MLGDPRRDLPTSQCDPDRVGASRVLPGRRAWCPAPLSGKTHPLVPTRSVTRGRAEGLKGSSIHNKEIRNKGISLEHYLRLVLFHLPFFLRELRPLLESLLRCCNSPRDSNP